MKNHSSSNCSDRMSIPSQASQHSLASSSSSSATSSAPTLSTSRARRRGSRTLVACEACKKRKTKCSGRPAPCEACHKLDTFCHFNSRLDARRKTAYKPIALHERREFIFSGILKVLKHNDPKDVNHLLDMIRSDALPQEIAACLSQNLHQLQDRGLISSLEVDEMDLVSLGLQGLFSHRGKRATFISKDQTNYNGTTSKTHAANCRDTMGTHLDSNASDDLSSVNQDFHSFIKDASLASPVTTEASGSLCSEESYATVASSYKRPMSNQGGPSNAVASGPFSVRSKKPKGNYYNPPTLECDTGKETPRQSLERSKAQRTALIHPFAFEGSENPQGPTYNPMSSTDRLYMAFTADSRGSLDERMTRDHLESHKPMNSTPVSAECAPPIEWHAQQWAYETENPPFRPYAFNHEVNNIGLNAAQHPAFNETIFTDHIFHNEHAFTNPKINAACR